jgi:hypothetical protein
MKGHPPMQGVYQYNLRQDDRGSLKVDCLICVIAQIVYLQ